MLRITKDYRGIAEELQRNCRRMQRITKDYRGITKDSLKR